MEHANAVSRARQPADRRYRQDRILHLIEREVVSFARFAWPEGTEPEYRKVSLLEIGERRYYAWQEAVERQVVVGELRFSDLAAGPLQIPFAFSGRRDLEPLRDQNGGIAGVLIRTQQPIEDESR